MLCLVENANKIEVVASGGIILLVTILTNFLHFLSISIKQIIFLFLFLNFIFIQFSDFWRTTKDHKYLFGLPM